MKLRYMTVAYSQRDFRFVSYPRVWRFGPRGRIERQSKKTLKTCMLLFPLSTLVCTRAAYPERAHVVDLFVVLARPLYVGSSEQNESPM